MPVAGGPRSRKGPDRRARRPRPRIPPRPASAEAANRRTSKLSNRVKLGPGVVTPRRRSRVARVRRRGRWCPVIIRVGRSRAVVGVRRGRWSCVAVRVRRRWSRVARIGRARTGVTRARGRVHRVSVLPASACPGAATKTSDDDCAAILIEADATLARRAPASAWNAGVALAAVGAQGQQHRGTRHCREPGSIARDDSS